MFFSFLVCPDGSYRCAEYEASAMVTGGTNKAAEGLPSRADIVCGGNIRVNQGLDERLFEVLEEP